MDDTMHACMHPWRGFFLFKSRMMISFLNQSSIHSCWLIDVLLHAMEAFCMDLHARHVSSSHGDGMDLACAHGDRGNLLSGETPCEAPHVMACWWCHGTTRSRR